MTQTSNNGLIGSAVVVVLLFHDRQALGKWLHRVSEALTGGFSGKAECLLYGKLVSILLILRFVTLPGDMGSIRVSG